MSVGLDVSFPSSSFIYGLPEHASTLILQSTRAVGDAKTHYSEPYRLYNLDVFEYELDETMALYGNITFVLGHGKAGDKAISTVMD